MKTRSGTGDGSDDSDDDDEDDDEKWTKWTRSGPGNDLSSLAPTQL
jgi:hypothetical protein